MKPSDTGVVLRGYGGAFAVVVVRATSELELRRLVEIAMGRDNLHVVEIEDVELLEDRLRVATLAAEVLDLAAALSESEPVGVDVFQTYPVDEFPT